VIRNPINRLCSKRVSWKRRSWYWSCRSGLRQCK